MGPQDLAVLGLAAGNGVADGGGKTGVGSAVLGLPGNPVSTFVNFEILAKAVLARLRGLRYDPTLVPARLGREVRRGSADRVEFLPARLEAGEVNPVRYGGSSMLSALAEANALLRMEIGQYVLEGGAEILVRLV